MAIGVRAQLKRHRFCQQICLTSARGFDTRQHRDLSRSSTARMTHSGNPCDEPGEHRRRGYCTGLAASSVNHRRRTTTCVTLTFNVIPALGKDFSLVREKAEALDGQRRRKLLCCTRRERREPWGDVVPPSAIPRHFVLIPAFDLPSQRVAVV